MNYAANKKVRQRISKVQLLLELPKIIHMNVCCSWPCAMFTGEGMNKRLLAMFMREFLPPFVSATFLRPDYKTDSPAMVLGEIFLCCFSSCMFTGFICLLL